MQTAIFNFWITLILQESERCVTLIQNLFSFGKHCKQRCSGISLWLLFWIMQQRQRRRKNTELVFSLILSILLSSLFMLNCKICVSGSPPTLSERCFLTKVKFLSNLFFCLMMQFHEIRLYSHFIWYTNMISKRD